MSPTDTAHQADKRTGATTARGRTIAALIGAGALAAVPLTVQAADGGGLARGDQVTPSKKTPAVVKSSLRSDGPVVIAFLLPGITEDEIVQKRLNTLRQNSKFKDTKFIVYRITARTNLGDLPAMFSVKYTPAVAVIQGDDKLANVWRGLVDEDIIAQSLIDARAAVPQPVKVTPRKGGVSGAPAGISLARRVNAHYAKVPGLGADFSGSFGGVAGATGSSQTRLVDGKARVMSGKAAAGGKSVDIVINRTGLYSKAAGAACWTRTATSKAVAGLGDPVIPVQGVRFAAPVKSKDGATFSLKGTDLLGQYGGGTFVYTIDAKSLEVTAVAHGATTATVKALAKAPAIGKPNKIC